MPTKSEPLEALTVESFTRRLIGNMAQELEAVVGEDEARQIVQLVGLGMGEEIERVVAPGVVKDLHGEWTPRELADVLVELKRRINGDFYVESASADKIVLGNRRCPFGSQVLGKPSLCMMTSSVFGGIAARHFGYARVDVDEAIARGDHRCRVVVHLKEPAGEPTAWSEEYVGPGAGES